jgi:hypothetical protein
MADIYLIVTIDVEPDCTPTWHYSNPLQFKGVFDKYNITPTYLINNVVLENDEAVAVFKSLGEKAELGTHLHPEFIEPNIEFENYAGKKGEANCCFYEPQIERQKLINITQLFKRQFGYNPQCFRAGRYSAGKNTIAVLGELNYKVDTSVTPGICWDDKTREQPVNYSSCSTQPYWVDPTSFPAASGKSKILEVPITITNKPVYTLRKLARFIKTGSTRSFLIHNWLRPHFSSLSKLKEVVTNVEKNFEANNDVILNMMFHNVEVMPGLSPYCITAKDAKEYLAALEGFLLFCKSKGIKSAKLSSVYDKFK